jgi:hypothetical protein
MSSLVILNSPIIIVYLPQIYRNFLSSRSYLPEITWLNDILFISLNSRSAKHFQWKLWKALRFASKIAICAEFLYSWNQIWVSARKETSKIFFPSVGTTWRYAIARNSCILFLNSRTYSISEEIFHWNNNIKFLLSSTQPGISQSSLCMRYSRTCQPHLHLLK